MNIVKVACNVCAGTGRQETYGMDQFSLSGGACMRCKGARVIEGEERYVEMPIGRATVVLCHLYGELLCVKRGHDDNRKLKLKRRWWRRSEVFLRNNRQKPVQVQS